MGSAAGYEYTLNMESIFRGKISALKSFYCREDIEQALQDVKRASEDSYHFRLHDMNRLCKARGLDGEALLEDASPLGEIPGREQMREKLLQAFYDMYQSFPKTTDYMERIVRRLAPEYSHDSVRVAILKKFLAGAGPDFKRFQTKQILEWGKRRLSQEELSLFDTLSPGEQQMLTFSGIDDSIFSHKPVTLSKMDILLLIAGRMERYRADTSLAFSQPELGPDTEALLDGILKKFRPDSGASSAYDRIQEAAGVLKQSAEDEAGDEIGRFVELLEKDFRNQLRKIPRVSRTGAEGNAAELYKQAKKDALKAARAEAKKTEPDYELLDMCNDLAAGNFRVNGKTKVYLYYFAIMFGMTVPLEGREYEPERDLVKNLFQDFYNDNLLRLLAGDYTDPGMTSAFEKEPTGEGINYKSFVEVIYLYFICHDELELSPGQRIDCAEEIIEKSIRIAKTKESRITTAWEHTEEYRTRHIQILLNKKVDEIAEYVAENYLVISPENIGAARIMVAAEENTAFDLIGEIMDMMDSVYPEVEMFDVWKKKTLPEDVRAEIAFRTDPVFDWKLKSLLEEKFSEDADFRKVVTAIDERLHVNSGRYNRAQRLRMITLLHVLAVYSDETRPMSMYRIQSKMEEKGVLSIGTQLGSALSGLRDIGFDIQREGERYYLGKRSCGDVYLDTFLDRVIGRYLVITEDMEMMLAELLIQRLRFDKRITRSELISIHFSYYITLLNETEGLDTFPDVFEDYDATISPILEEARYQPLSEKNIFDMYVVTELYFYLIENNGYI